jgi:DNA excision repair protein ERCC-5
LTCGDGRDEDAVPEEEYVYVDQLTQTPDQRKAEEAQRKRKRKEDQYQLPEMEHDLENMGAPNDVRILSAEELKEYAKQFESEGGGNIGDYADIDFSSPFFQALPDADRYRIINQARLRSRLRMGYSKEQLDVMFPDRMAFSRFQIERVARRNELSQRLMNLQGRDQDFSLSRVAGEKNREYVLARNEGKEGGWIMSFVGNKGDVEGERNRPIDVETLGKGEKGEGEDEDDEGEFEDVPIEGLNRLPKVTNPLPQSILTLGDDEARELRRALYESRMDGTSNRKPNKDAMNDTDTLFLGDEDLFGADDGLPETFFEDDEELEKAIAMSLGGQGFDKEGSHGFSKEDSEDDNLQMALALSMGDDWKGKGKAIESPKTSTNGENTDDVDFQQAVEESLRTQGTKTSNATQTTGESSGSATSRKPPKLFGGLAAPLDLSKSTSFLLNNQKSRKPTPLRLPNLKERKELPKDKEVKPVPLPPWFSAGSSGDIMSDVEKSQKQTKREQQEYHDSLKEQRLEQQQRRNKEVVEIESDKDSEVEFVDIDVGASSTDKPVTTDGLADRLKAVPPASGQGNREAKLRVEPKTMGRTVIEVPGDSDEDLEWSGSDGEGKTVEKIVPRRPSPPKERQNLPTPEPSTIPAAFTAIQSTEPSFRGPSPPPAELEEPDDLDLDLTFDYDSPPPEITLEDADETELLRQMALETVEHARFAASLSSDTATYESELLALRAQQKRDRRDADEVTQIMIQECQQLLTLFGLPYITAPMEAEAQCAELVKLRLVDGIVTDDSDVFLFGGDRVYRYMFNDRQTVQCYLAEDLRREFSLDQHRLISTALLLGSDYTEGVPNIGPVSAIELLAEFENHEGLKGFKAWWSRVQSGTDVAADESSSPFRRKFKRANTAKIFLPADFPNTQVEDAYLHPEVDSDTSEFEWGVPDLEGLRSFLMNTVGWGKERTDQILVPVVRDMNVRLVEGGQSNITRFFGDQAGTGAWAPRVRVGVGSARLEKAMDLLHRKAEGGGDVGEGGASAVAVTGRKRMRSMREFAEEEEEDEVVEVMKQEAEEEQQPGRKKSKAKTRPRTKANAGRGRGRGKKRKT